MNLSFESRRYSKIALNYVKLSRFSFSATAFSVWLLKPADNSSFTVCPEGRGDDRKRDRIEAEQPYNLLKFCSSQPSIKP